MLAACLINGSPHLLNFEHICHLHCLFAPIVAIVDTIHTRGMAHVALFKKLVRLKDTESFMKTDGQGEVYPS